MASVDAAQGLISHYNSDVQNAINDKIDVYAIKAYQEMAGVVREGLVGLNAIISGEGSQEQKMGQLPAYFQEYVKKHTTDKGELFQQYTELQESTDQVAKNIFSHLSTKVGLAFTEPQDPQMAAAGLGNFIGFMGHFSGDPNNAVRFFAVGSMPYFQPLMDDLRREFTPEVLAQFPPFQK